MCEYCENGHPTGAGLEEGDEKNACKQQIAESLRDAIRATCPKISDIWAEEIDRCINALIEADPDWST